MHYLCAAALLLLLCHPTPAVAADDPAGAKAAYLRGAEEYRLGRYDSALVEFRRALELSGRAALLFNIALCYEKLGDPRRSAQNYRLYLRAEPGAPEGEQIERHIVELEGRARALEEGLKVDPPRPITAQPRAPDAPRGRLRATWGLIAVTGAALAAALGTGLAGRARENELADRCPGDRCPTDLRALADEGSRLYLATDVLIGVGGAAAIGALVAGLVERRRRPWVSLAPVVAPGAVGLLVEFRR